MADSHTSQHVESPLVRSVVDLSTTGVDANKSEDTAAVLGARNRLTALSLSDSSPSTHTTSVIRNCHSQLQTSQNNAPADLENTEGGIAGNSMVSSGVQRGSDQRADIGLGSMEISNRGDMKMLEAIWKDWAVYHPRNSTVKFLRRSRLSNPCL
jgi:hypothetical protein